MAAWLLGARMLVTGASALRIASLSGIGLLQVQERKLALMDK